MGTGQEHRTDTDILDALDEGIDALVDDRLRLDSDRDLLNLLDRSVGLISRLQAWQARIITRVEEADATWTARGTSTRTWLTEHRNVAPRDAARLLLAADRLRRFPTMAEAARQGQVLKAQSDALTAVLDVLPDDFSAQQVADAESEMIAFARTHHAGELRRLGSRLVELIDPVGADRREADLLERQRIRAMRDRHLSFINDHHGSVLIRGSLPTADAEPFRRLVDAHAAAVTRGLERVDAEQPRVTPGMRRADGLMALVAAHQQEALAPSHGGDRPRLVVTLDHETLMRVAADAGLIEVDTPGAAASPVGGNDGDPPHTPSGAVLSGRILATGEPVDPGTLRRLLCDADLLPVAMGGASLVLDVGRAQRLVTPDIRVALDRRDQGCAFPGCEVEPQACHAHHIQPWWAGGVTALHNLVLVCPHHHGIVEPGRDPTADRWRIRLRHPDQQPEVIPPLRVDPLQRPRQHVRFRPRPEDP